MEYTATNFEWDCAVSARLPMLYAGQHNVAFLNIVEYFTMSEFHPKSGDPSSVLKYGSPEPVRSHVEKLRMTVDIQTEGKIALICVHVIEVAMQPYGAVTLFVDKNMVSNAHYFTLAVAKEGIRVFQGMKFSSIIMYRGDEYIRSGGSRLRDWKEVDKFLTNLEIIGAAVSWLSFIGIMLTMCLLRNHGPTRSSPRINIASKFVLVKQYTH